MKKIKLILLGLLICASGYGQELHRFKESGKYGFRDANGKVIIPAKYYDARDFSEDLAAVEITGKTYTVGRLWGYIDKTGTEVIPPKYYTAEDFSEGLAAVDGEKGYGYIDKTGNIVIPMQYTMCTNFTNGSARAVKSNKVIYIDKTGVSELCKSPLISYIQQANSYRSKLNKTSSDSTPFQIFRPYLIIHLDDDCEKTTIRDASIFKDKRFDEYFVHDLKTLIFLSSYPDYTKTYFANNNSNKTEVTSYGTYIIYFDMTKKEVIGYDNFRGRLDFPYAIDANLIGNSLSNGYTDIEKKIESHLATSEK